MNGLIDDLSLSDTETILFFFYRHMLTEVS